MSKQAVLEQDEKPGEETEPSEDELKAVEDELKALAKKAGVGTEDEEKPEDEKPKDEGQTDEEKAAAEADAQAELITIAAAQLKGIEDPEARQAVIQRLAEDAGLEIKLPGQSEAEASDAAEAGKKLTIADITQGLPPVALEDGTPVELSDRNEVTEDGQVLVDGPTFVALSNAQMRREMQQAQAQQQQAVQNEQQLQQEVVAEAKEKSEKAGAPGAARELAEFRHAFGDMGEAAKDPALKFAIEAGEEKIIAKHKGSSTEKDEVEVPKSEESGGGGADEGLAGLSPELKKQVELMKADPDVDNKDIAAFIKEVKSRL